jgi:quercetin dioxygenase-like cupin family protein
VIPVLRRDDDSAKPSWVEVDDFDLFDLDFRRPDGGVRTFTPSHPKEHLVCLAGEVTVEWDGGRVTLQRKDWLDISGREATVTTSRTTAMTGTSELLWFAGHWPETTYISLFHFTPDHPCELHYHDNDEYWFCFRGHFEGVYDGQPVSLRPGDVLATGQGIEHGMPHIEEVVEGVGFTPALRGQRRFGHLHRDEHGDPVPYHPSEEDR